MMKKFILTVLSFGLPLLLFYSAAEYYCLHQTNFSIKKHWLETNLAATEVLVLGSSHSQNAVNPEYMSRSTCNLAFGGQPLSIDYFLLEKYISRMPALQTVFLEVSPHRFYDDLEITNWNGYVYANLYRIPYKTESFSFKNHVLVLSNLKFFTSIYLDHLNPFGYKYELNKYGFITNDSNDRFARSGYDSAWINSSYRMLHEFDNQENFAKNEQFLQKTIRLCQEKGVHIILLSPPLYRTYREQIPAHAAAEVNALIRRTGAPYADFSANSTFSLRDFKNDNHLSLAGAKTFTLLLDSLDRNQGQLLNALSF